MRPRKDILMEAGLKPGFQVLDYGCGPGSYTVIAAELVGANGKVYALDIHPLAIKKVRELASRKRLENIETILSGCATGLEYNSVDVVLLYDVFHDLGNPEAVMLEIHRVLRPDGLVSFSDHHMDDGEIVSEVTKTGLFKLSTKGNKTHSFAKAW
ncbi:MAG: class I SAM-dependent methyltransferase [Dehalococcoidia bacterium]|nr:MAG: class I SAM-dependent methyltransferase [Dehalococcoidia bacterium]